MPNVITNLYFARRAAPKGSPEFYLGAVLPNFMDMYRAYNGDVITPGQFMSHDDIRDGLRFHREVGAYHHDNPYYEEMARLSAEDLRDTAYRISKPQATRLGGAITDMTLDGELVWPRRGRARGLVALMKDYLDDGPAVMSDPSLKDFEDFMRFYFEEGNLRRYTSAFEISRLLHSLIGRGRVEKLRFPESMVPSLLPAIARQQDRMKRHMPAMARVTLRLWRQEPELVNPVPLRAARLKAVR